MGKAVDGFVGRSETTQTLLKDYLSGDASLVEDLKEILSRPALSAQDVQSLTLAAILGRLAAKGDGATKAGAQQLLAAPRSSGSTRRGCRSGCAVRGQARGPAPTGRAGGEARGEENARCL